MCVCERERESPKNTHRERVQAGNVDSCRMEASVSLIKVVICPLVIVASFDDQMMYVPTKDVSAFLTRLSCTNAVCFLCEHSEQQSV